MRWADRCVSAIIGQGVASANSALHKAGMWPYSPERCARTQTISPLVRVSAQRIAAAMRA